MRGDAKRPDVSQVPREADVVVGALLMQLRRPHRLERSAAQQPLAARRRCRRRDGIARRRGDLSMHNPTPPAVTLTDGENGRIMPAGSSPRLMWPAANRWTMKSPAVVPACFRPRGGRPDRDRAVDRRAGDRFDHAARHAEAGVVVAPRRRGRRDLHQIGHHRRGEVAQRVLATFRT